MLEKTRAIIDWISAALVYLLTLLIIPVSNKLLGNLSETEANVIINAAINILVAAVFIFLLVYLLRQGGKASVTGYLCFLAVLSITVYFLINVQGTSDRLHFLGYAALSLFLYRALRYNIETKLIYFWAMFINISFAILDECLQFSGAGGRTFGLNDIATDWLSSVVSLAIIEFIFRPKMEPLGLKMRRWRDDLKKKNLFEAEHSEQPKK
jgi:hypothetical protein